MMQSAPFNFRRLVIWIGRLAISGIFLYAGYSKLFTPNMMLQSWFTFKFSIASNLSNFGQHVRSYKLLSESGVSFVSLREATHFILVG